MTNIPSGENIQNGQNLHISIATLNPDKLDIEFMAGKRHLHLW